MLQASAVQAEPVASPEPAAPGMTPFNGYPWRESYALGHDQVDDTHREFVELIDAMMRADDDSFPGLMDRFIAHTREHFAQESALMARHAFPAVGCHEREHQEILDSTLAVRERVADGDLATGRYLVNLLGEWFPHHADHMDRGLTIWIDQLAQGQVPQGGCCG